MGDLVELRPSIAPMSQEAIGKVKRLEDFSLENLPQVEIRISEVLHAGMYARTAFVPAGLLMTGALIKIPTLLVIEGYVSVYVGDDEPLEVTGYSVLCAAAGRKQAFRTHSQTVITMIFPTAAKTAREAEDEFTSEAAMLQTRREV